MPLPSVIIVLPVKYREGDQRVTFHETESTPKLIWDNTLKDNLSIRSYRRISYLGTG